MTDEQIKHLEFIQDVVTRMNSNSFQLKGWCITILSALCAIYSTERNVGFIAVSFMPTILFWCLDAYYLQQERRFRGLYRDVAKGNEEISVFSMPIHRYKGGEYSFWASFRSKTILGLYGTLLLLIIIAVVALSHCSVLKSIFHCCQ